MVLVRYSLVIGFLVAISCSAHRRRIDTARHDGNEPLAACFEACRPDDDACVATCQQQHPTGWRHRVGASVRPMTDAAAQVHASLAASLHPLAVRDARAAGNEPLATCYEQCHPTATVCLHACENQHARPDDAERRREMLALATKIGVEAYKRDRAQKDAWAASNGPSNDPRRTGGSFGGAASSGSSSGRPPSGGSSSGASSSGGSSSGAPANIHFGKSCSECASSLQHGLGCTMPAKATCGDGELRTGAGFCAARPTDRGGTCSARCSSAGDCPAGYSCADLGTGASVCMR